MPPVSRRRTARATTSVLSPRIVSLAGERVIDPRGTATMVGLLGWPTSHSLSPPMHNAGIRRPRPRLGVRPRCRPRPPRPPAGCRSRPARDGVCGGKRDDPAQAGRDRFLRRARRHRAAAGSVNTLVFDAGRILGSSTDGDAVTAQVDANGRRASCSAPAAQLSGGRRGARPRRSGGDGASRRESAGRPRPTGTTPSSATPVKEELIVAPHECMQVVDLAYLPDGRETALRRSRPECGPRRRRRRPRRAPVSGCGVLRALDGPAGAARRDARSPPRPLRRRSILRHHRDGKGGRS